MTHIDDSEYFYDLGPGDRVCAGDFRWHQNDKWRQIHANAPQVGDLVGWWNAMGFKFKRRSSGPTVPSRRDSMCGCGQHEVMFGEDPYAAHSKWESNLQGLDEDLIDDLEDSIKLAKMHKHGWHRVEKEKGCALCVKK